MPSCTRPGCLPKPSVRPRLLRCAPVNRRVVGSLTSEFCMFQEPSLLEQGASATKSHLRAVSAQARSGVPCHMESLGSGVACAAGRVASTDLGQAAFQPSGLVYIYIYIYISALLGLCPRRTLDLSSVFSLACSALELLCSLSISLCFFSNLFQLVLHSNLTLAARSATNSCTRSSETLQAAVSPQSACVRRYIGVPCANT